MSEAQALELVIKVISATASTLQEMGIDVDDISEDHVNGFVLGMLATLIELGILDAESAHEVVVTLTRVGSQVREEMKYRA